MNKFDISRMVAKHARDDNYDGDNREFICYSLLPFLKLHDYDKQVIRWAYGYDGEKTSYEMLSDGETGVKDYFLNGAIKAPCGVVHDYINRVPLHTTPDGKTWTRMESNRLYLRVAKAIGYPPVLRWRRFVFLSGTWFWWRKVKPVRSK